VAKLAKVSGHDFSRATPAKTRDWDIRICMKLGCRSQNNLFGSGMSLSKQKCHPDRSLPGFPATLHWTEPRMRLSVTERRMKCTSATKLNRKSGGAKWRDLLFIIRSIESEWKRNPPLCHPDRSEA
jgi:hypothetical protein